MSAPLPSLRPIVVAHRAGNSLDQIRAAEHAGADLVEADVWLYRGRLEVRHTKTVRAIPVLWDRWSIQHGLGPRLTLDAMLAALRPTTGILLDLKGNDRRLPGTVLGALRAHPRPGAMAVCSQNWKLLPAFAAEPDITVIHSIGGFRRLRRVLAGGAPQMQAISVHERFLHAEMVQALKTIAPLVITWPVNDPSRLETLLAQGVDGVICDDLTLAREAVATRDFSRTTATAAR